MLMRHMFCALLMLPAATPATASQEEVCRAESIIAELDRKDPKTVARILREAGEVENSQAMLWRIERGGTPASYLFGTIHVGDRSLSELSPKTLVALRASSTVALEAEQVSAKQMPYIMAQAGKLMSARDKPLQHKLDADELSVVERSLVASGYPSDLALGIRPWVAILFLTGSNCQGPERPGTKPLDLIISDEARRAGQKLIGLETMLEQFQSLSEIDDEVQLSWLRASIATHDRIDDITHTMAELYRFRRINAVWELTRELATTAKLTDADLSAIQAGLVAKRNVRLADRSVPLLEAGGAFVAVGALHLSGRDGLVAAFRSRGYTLHPIE